MMWVQRFKPQEAILGAFVFPNYFFSTRHTRPISRSSSLPLVSAIIYKTAMNLQPTIDYLTVFFNGHISKYREMMVECGRNKGPELYEGRDETMQMIRDIVLGVEDEFADMTIPGNFATPFVLLQRFEAYRDLASEHAKRVAEIVEKAKGWYSETTCAAQITNEVAAAISYALTLSETKVAARPAIERLTRIVNALPAVARQLLKRRNEAGVPRPTLKINDEYDVQDLLHSLLHIEFSDVRAEEWTPSFAGATKRTDFLLRPEDIFVEVKKTSSGLKQSAVADELTIDIAAYRSHPRAKHLVCVVWDVDCILQNPVALKTDLEEASPSFVTVLVVR